MKNISDAVNSDIYRVSRESNRLKQLVSQCMPPELANEILFARIAEQKLRLTVGNSAWAARLRFHSREILRRLAASETPVRDISVHVLPQGRNIKVAARVIHPTKLRASEKSVSNIRQVAESLGGEVDGDDQLKRALGRLASHLERN